MKKFEFDYDEDNDNLFIYLPESKSAGAVEIGDFAIDFDENENLAAIEISNASEILSKLSEKIIELSKIKELRVNVINFRNMAFISLEIDLNDKKEKINIHIPRIKEQSPALNY